jgi:hypothetical protein
VSKKKSPPRATASTEALTGLAQWRAQIAAANAHAQSMGLSLDVLRIKPKQVDAISGALQPHFGEVLFTPPPSYRMFLTEIGVPQVCESETVEFKEGLFTLVLPEDIPEDAADLVFVPQGVEVEPMEGGQPQVISTNHLVPFACDGDSEQRWCFVVDPSAPQGEYRVAMHHQDDPYLAKVVSTGAWLNPGVVEWATEHRLMFANFETWWTAYAARFLRLTPENCWD